MNYYAVIGFVVSCLSAECSDIYSSTLRISDKSLTQEDVKLLQISPDRVQLSMGLMEAPDFVDAISDKCHQDISCLRGAANVAYSELSSNHVGAAINILERSLIRIGRIEYLGTHKSHPALTPYSDKLKDLADYTCASWPEIQTVGGTIVVCRLAQKIGQAANSLRNHFTAINSTTLDLLDTSIETVKSHLEQIWKFEKMTETERLFVKKFLSLYPD